MNKESIKLWLALLKEWLDELDCEDVAGDETGFHFLYAKAIIRLDIAPRSEIIDVCVTYHLNVRGFGLHLSEFDICDPNITPSERFHILEHTIKQSLMVQNTRVWLLTPIGQQAASETTFAFETTKQERRPNILGWALTAIIAIIVGIISRLVL